MSQSSCARLMTAYSTNAESIVPIYFALSHEETTAVSAAIEFLNAFLSQYLAFRRHEPELVHASLTLSDLLGARAGA